MSPNNIRAKAEKFRKLFSPMYTNAHLLGRRPVVVTIKYSTLRELVNLFGELAEKPQEVKP